MWALIFFELSYKFIQPFLTKLVFLPTRVGRHFEYWLKNDFPTDIFWGTFFWANWTPIRTISTIDPIVPRSCLEKPSSEAASLTPTTSVPTPIIVKIDGGIFYCGFCFFAFVISSSS